MERSLKEYILAMVTIDSNRIRGGGCPLFLASSCEEMEKTSLLLARILGGTVHDLENGVFIIVKH